MNVIEFISVFIIENGQEEIVKWFEDSLNAVDIDTDLITVDSDVITVSHDSKDIEKGKTFLMLYIESKIYVLCSL